MKEKINGIPFARCVNEIRITFHLPYTQKGTAIPAQLRAWTAHFPRCVDKIMVKKKEKRKRREEHLSRPIQKWLTSVSLDDRESVASVVEEIHRGDFRRDYRRFLRTQFCNMAEWIKVGGRLGVVIVGGERSQRGALTTMIVARNGGDVVTLISRKIALCEQLSRPACFRNASRQISSIFRISFLDHASFARSSLFDGNVVSRNKKHKEIST